MRQKRVVVSSPQQALASISEQGSFFNCSGPNHAGVDRKIGVSQDVAESGDLTPWDIGFRTDPVFRKRLHSFANDFENADNRILRFEILIETGKIEPLKVRL